MPAGGMERLSGLPPVASRYVPASASAMPSTSRRRGARLPRRQETARMMSSCRHCRTVAVPALVRRTEAR